MRRHRFTGNEIDPAVAVATIKRFLVDNDLQIDREIKQQALWDLRASRRGIVRVAFGAVRDADVVVAGGPGDFEVQFKLAIWGKDLVVPVVEGSVTVGVAAAVDAHEEHRLEEAL